MTFESPILDVSDRDAASAARPDESLRNFVRGQLLEHLLCKGTAGTRLPSIRQLSSQFNVAIGTVQAAIRDLVNAGVLISRPTVGTVVSPSCTPDRIRALQTESAFAQQRGRHMELANKTVKIFHVAQNDRFIEDIARQVSVSLTKLGCSVETRPVEQAIPAKLKYPDADAIVAIQPSHWLEPQLEAHQVLLVIASERVDVNATGRYDLIAVDDDHGSFLAGRRLKEAGCRHACFIGARDRRQSATALHATSLRRLRGFERGWGNVVAPERQLVAGAYDIEPGEKIAPAFLALSPRPEAVFAATDELALGLIRGVREHGLVPGRDFQIIGFDKQDRAVNLPDGPLTTIEIPRIQMAVRGAQALAERLNDPDQPIHRVYLGCRLFEGATVRPLTATRTSTPGESA